MLNNRNPYSVEPGQSQTIANAGGGRLDGDFIWRTTGWELILRKLSFRELVLIEEAVRKIVE